MVNPLFATPSEVGPGHTEMAKRGVPAQNRAMRKALRIGLIVAGTAATLGSAAIGLRALAASCEVDELDGRGGIEGALRRASSGEGPLRGLRAGERILLHYRSSGCFHQVDTDFTFKRRADGRIYLTRVAPGGWDHERLVTRALTEAEITGFDRQLVYAQHAPPGTCTTRADYDLVIRKGPVETRAHFVDKTCELPALPPGAVTLYALASAR